MAVGNYQAHPEIVAYISEQLRSINDRVFALVQAVHGDTDAGATYPALGVRWLDDLAVINRIKTVVVDDPNIIDRAEETE